VNAQCAGGEEHGGGAPGGGAPGGGAAGGGARGGWAPGGGARGGEGRGGGAVPAAAEERLRRWRLVLGEEGLSGVPLGEADAGRDGVLAALYGRGGPGARGQGAQGAREARRPSGPRTAGLGGSSPSVARWLGDVRTYFPTSVVRLIQHDAIERLGLRQLLLEPETLGQLEPDVSLVATLVSLRNVIPTHSLETARSVVRHVTGEIEKRLADKLRSAVAGALNRCARTRRPRHGDIDWDRTIRANLRHYQPELRTVIPETLIGYGRRHPSFEREVVVAIDQSGSMAASVIYSSVFGSVLAGMRALETHLVAFDTSVVDLTAEMQDPVDVLFGLQLGGGTDINRAVAYCQGLIARPSDTVFVLVSDLYEGGVKEELVRRMGSMIRSGVTCIALLALSDEGAPAYDHQVAATLGGLGMACFACTPDLFPDLMAAAIERRDLTRWLAERGVVAAGSTS